MYTYILGCEWDGVQLTIYKILYYLHIILLVIHLLHIPCTNTKYKPHGPVSLNGLSAFSLLSHHLQTNTVCHGPGSSTTHSTFHYWVLIIEGWEAAGEAVERGRGRNIEKEWGLARQKEWRDDRLLYFPLHGSHLEPEHALLKTSLRHLLSLSNTDISVVPSIHLSTLSHPQFPSSFFPSPSSLHFICED